MTKNLPGLDGDDEAIASVAGRDADLRPAPPMRTGCVLADLEFGLLGANESAVQILCYPHAPERPTELQRRIRAIVGAERCTAVTLRTHFFLSGHRHYACRPFLLDAPHTTGSRPAVVLLLERWQRRPVDFELLTAGVSFPLSPRERETVRGVMLGLTNKEIAREMRVSPHTVKQFIRQIMWKTGVTTRAGIVGRMVSTYVRTARDPAPDTGTVLMGDAP